MLVSAFNPTTDELEKSNLASATSVGATTLTVRNGDRFSANDRIMIGEMGREKTEIVTVSAVNADNVTLTVGTTLYSHEADDPIYVLRFDQIKFYRADTLTGTYSILATVALDVDNADLRTRYDDTTGTSSNYYKVSFYHSIDMLESDLSDPMQGTGFARGTVGAFIDELLRELRDENQTYVDRNIIMGWCNEVNDDLQTRLKQPFDFLHTRTTLPTSASVETVDFPTDMWKFDQLNYYYDDPDNTTTKDMIPIRVISLEEFRYRFQDQTTDPDSDILKYVALDTAVNKFRLYPPPETSQGGVLYLYYWKYFTELSDDADEFETPNPKVYKDFCRGQFYRLKAVNDSSFQNISDRFFTDYSVEVSKLIKTNGKDQGSPKSFKMLPQTMRGNRKY